MATETTKWTKPYYGVSHMTPEGKKSRVSVADFVSFAILTCWYPGCGFSPRESRHDTAQQAKTAGEQWLSEAA